MMKLRLEGKTLEEIGNAIGVTRERVRQLVKVTSSTKQTFKEDENAYWFSNYNLDKSNMNRCSKITYITIYLIDMKKVLSYGKIFLMMKKPL